MTRKPLTAAGFINSVNRGSVTQCGVASCVPVDCPVIFNSWQKPGANHGDNCFQPAASTQFAVSIFQVVIDCVECPVVMTGDLHGTFTFRDPLQADQFPVGELCGCLAERARRGLGVRAGVLVACFERAACVPGYFMCSSHLRCLEHVDFKLLLEFIISFFNCKIVFYARLSLSARIPPMRRFA